MAFLSRELVWLLCIVGYFHRMNASTVKFSASPIEIIANITQTSSMRCSLEDGNTSSIPTPDVRRVTSIFVTKEDGTDVASITTFDPAMALVDLGIMDCKGSLSATSNDGFLELSWSDASRMTLGGYKCVITGIDTRGHTVVMNSDLKMTSVAPSISDVLGLLQKQQTQINAQETINANQHQLQQKLQACIAARVAFTAVMDAGFTSDGSHGLLRAESKQVLKFDKTLTNEGGDYNSSSGQFVCRSPGLYTFTVNTLVVKDDTFCIQLQLNGHEVTSTYAFDHDSTTAASTTAAMHLQPGDVVRVRTSCDSYLVKSPTFVPHGNSFTGVLVQADACMT